jgi:hypothetical protein
MDPQSFIVGLMAGITLFGGAILTAMIVLEQPRQCPRTCSRLITLSRSRLRHWLDQKWPRQKITQEWLEAEADHARQRERMLQELEHRRTDRPAKGQTIDRADKNGPSKDVKSPTRGSPGP